MTKHIHLPFYIKIAFLLVGLYALVSMLFFAKSIIVPLLFSTIFGVLLSPLVNGLTRLKFNRVIAIIIVLLSLVCIMALAVVLFAQQIIVFADSAPIIIDKVYKVVAEFVNWISLQFNVSIDNVHEMLENTKQEILIKTKSIIGPALINIKDILIVGMVMPVYIFMIIFYQPLLVEFIHRLYGEENKVLVSKILSSTKFIVQRYLLALLIEAAIMATLNTIGLYVLGIPYAILLGILGAFLNIIPYLGGIIAMLLYVVIALVTKDHSIYMLYVIMLYSVIQLIDNNLIMPKLVGSKVKINALVAIIVVVVGGTLWGVPGMFISLPLIAIVKLICDNIETLKPWGFLLGDTMPSINIFKKSKI
jgi:predicted PurR-regulated permease PerM